MFTRSGNLSHRNNPELRSAGAKGVISGSQSTTQVRSQSGHYGQQRSMQVHVGHNAKGWHMTD